MSSRLVHRTTAGPPLHFRLPHFHLEQVRAVQLVCPVEPWLLLLQWSRFVRIAQLNERGDVPLRLGLELSSKLAVGRDSLVLRGLIELLSFLGG